MRREAGGLAASRRPEFEFRSSPRSRDGGVRPEERRARIGAAIRAAHGAGITFEWRVRSGGHSSPRLWFPAAEGTRWWVRSLLPAYDGEGWATTTDPDPAVEPAERWYATRTREWPTPLRTSVDPGSWLDAISDQMELQGDGYELRWSARPAPLVRPPRAGPATVPMVGAARPERSLPPSARTSTGTTVESVDLAPAWWCRVVLRHRADASSPSHPQRTVRALESAARSANGSGLRFHRMRWPWRTEAPEFALSEVDVRDAFPLPGSPRQRNDPATASVLAVGRRTDGWPVGPSVEPDQGRHLAVLGETGMGKSSLLTAVCLQAARDDGVVLFDPFGDTARAVRAGLAGVAGERIRWIAPGTGSGVNALRAVGAEPGGGAGSERRLNDLVHALRRVRQGKFADGAFWGPRLEEMLGRALRAAAALPGGTLVEAHALLAAEGRGFRQVPPESMDAVRELADRIRARPEDADGARRLLFEVVRDADLVRLLCARDERFTASDLVRPGSIVLLAGDAPLVGETTARYLLSVFLALLWAELVARPTPAKTWVVLDESQWFAHEALAEMLRMARRCNVHVVLATQAVGSLPEPIGEAVWTNVSDFVIFRGSPADARELARSVRGVTVESILSLPRGHAFVLLGKGNVVERVRTVRPPTSVRPEPNRACAPRATVASTGAAEPPKPRDAGSEQELSLVLAALEHCVRDAGGTGPVRISLRDLRRRSDPTGRWVREMGARLARSGALRASGHDEDGTYWWIDPNRLPGRRPDAPDHQEVGPR